MTKTKAFKSPYVGIDSHAIGGLILTENGDYSFILKFDNPILQYSASVDAYYEFHSLFSNIIKVLGSGYTLQKQDVIAKNFYPEKTEDDFLKSKYFEHFQGRKYNVISTFLVITKSVRKNTFYKFNQNDFDAFVQNVVKVRELFSNKGIKAKILSAPECKSYLNKVLSLNFSDDVFSFDNISSSKNYLETGNSLIKSTSLVDIDEVNLPNSAKPYINVKDLGFDFPLDLMSFLHEVPNAELVLYNQVLCIPNQSTELNKLTSKQMRHKSMPDPSNEISVKDISLLLADVAKNSQLLVYAHFNVLVKSQKDDLEAALNFIESKLFSSGIIPSKNSYNQLELFRTCLPGNTQELKGYDKFLTTSDAALCFFFKERLLIDEKSNFNIYFTDRQGIPCAIDTNDLPVTTNRINNRNKFVLGPSGSGKSFFMNHLIRQYYNHNMDVVIVDTGHSYSGLCSYFNGKYITYTEEKPITMNPFRISLEEYNEEKREFIKSLIAIIWKGADATLTQIEETVLASVVENYFGDYFNNRISEPNYLSFNSFYKFSISNIKEIIKSEDISFDIKEYAYVLKRFYKGGQFENILNEELDNSLFDETFIVFEIDSIKEHKVLFPITTLIIMDVFLQKMRHKRNRKALIIEEAWKAIASPMMAEYILYLYKTVRKFWGEAIAVTQELEDIINNEIVKESILANSDTICLLDQSKFKDNYEDVSKLLSLNDVEKRKIFTINKLDNKFDRSRFKEVYIRRGAEGDVLGVEVSIYEYLIYTTERKEKEALQIYVSESVDFVTGLNLFVDDMRNSGLTLNEFVDHIHEKHQDVYPPIKAIAS